MMRKLFAKKLIRRNFFHFSIFLSPVVISFFTFYLINLKNETSIFKKISGIKALEANEKKSTQKNTQSNKFFVDTIHSSVEFGVTHLGIIPVKGKFKRFEGTFNYNPASNKVTNVLIKIDLDSVDTNEEDRDAHLRNKDFFNVRDDSYNLIKKHQYMTFEAKKISAPARKIKKQKWFEIKGDLTLLHITRTLKPEIKAQVISQKNKILTIAVEVKGKLNRKDFGITWDKPSTGLLEKIAGKAVGDWVEISAYLLAKPEKKK